MCIEFQKELNEVLVKGSRCIVCSHALFLKMIFPWSVKVQLRVLAAVKQTQGAANSLQISVEVEELELGQR